MLFGSVIEPANVIGSAELYPAAAHVRQHKELVFELERLSGLLAT